MNNNISPYINITTHPTTDIWKYPHFLIFFNPFHNTHNFSDLFSPYVCDSFTNIDNQSFTCSLCSNSSHPNIVLTIVYGVSLSDPFYSKIERLLFISGIDYSIEDANESNYHYGLVRINSRIAYNIPIKRNLDIIRFISILDML